MAHHFILLRLNPLTLRLIGRVGGLSTLCHSYGFTCQQRVKRFLALAMCIYIMYIIYIIYIYKAAVATALRSFASDTACIVFIHITPVVKPVHIFMAKIRVSKSCFHLKAVSLFPSFIYI